MRVRFPSVFANVFQQLFWICYYPILQRKISKTHQNLFSLIDKNFVLCFLNEHNFQIQYKGYYFTSLLLVRWLESIFNKNKKASIDNWTGSAFKTKIITTVLKLDFGFTNLLHKFGIRVYGLSCYCICKK